MTGKAGVAIATPGPRRLESRESHPRASGVRSYGRWRVSAPGAIQAAERHSETTAVARHTRLRARRHPHGLAWLEHKWTMQYLTSAGDADVCKVNAGLRMSAFSPRANG
jgi:hypothetical protein